MWIVTRSARFSRSGQVRFGSAWPALWIKPKEIFSSTTSNTHAPSGKSFRVRSNFRVFTATTKHHEFTMARMTCCVGRHICTPFDSSSEYNSTRTWIFRGAPVLVKNHITHRLHRHRHNGRCSSTLASAGNIKSWIRVANRKSVIIRGKLCCHPSSRVTWDIGKQRLYRYSRVICLLNSTAQSISVHVLLFQKNILIVNTTSIQCVLHTW